MKSLEFRQGIHPEGVFYAYISLVKAFSGYTTKMKVVTAFGMKVVPLSK